MLIERLSIKSPLDERTILKLPVACRTPITRGLLGLVEDRLVYYELIPTVTKHICRIIVPTSLRHTIFNDACSTSCWTHGEIQNPRIRY